ncbi:discoidin domain-containing protein [Actomonas aquatica]|uniref:Discoidin domain-containing protein n=1 Tax=Actomonas aquatica TaxID=2866162 RepID=A0ABZ1C9V8_9BACT|nr:discoidin domain-containing protein [Opitutus sp. WL0086]WRQ88435.1 discoidin domain-containing protein [Opitutus sp. WL0086]
MIRPLIFTALATCATVALAESKLELEFPPPKVTSTPAPIKLSNLEAPNTPAPDIMVPNDVTNVAAGKTVTSSDPWPIIGELDMVTDGDKESEDGYYVELGEMQQWVQIDLESETEIFGIGLWHYHAQPRAYLDVIVQVSNDPEFASGVTTLFNNDNDNSSDMGRGEDPAYLEKNYGRLIPGKQAKARYVRLYSNGNTSDGLNHYIEVEVFGRPVE